MRVEKVITSDFKERYMLLDDWGDPVEPVLRFLKYKDNIGSARNTLKAYCYHLKLFFEFLEQHNLDYWDVGIDDMALFMAWLHNPAGNSKVHYLLPQPSVRKPRTVNIIISSVLGFYDYIMRHEEYSLMLSERLTTKISGSKRNFKDFLYHITKDKLVKKKLLYVKAPKEKPRILSKDQICQLIDNCSNSRDKLLIHLLWESSMRIGEALRSI